MGFNGFARDLPDDEIPNVRPDKYPWIIHAEENALYHALSKGGVDGAIAYITGWPCIRCSNRLWHNGVRYWKILNDTPAISVDERELLNTFYKYTNAHIGPSKAMVLDPFKDEQPKNSLTIEIIRPDLNFMLGVVERCREAGLIGDFA